MKRTKWVVKKESKDGNWITISEHNTEKDARFFWRGAYRKGEKEFRFEEVSLD